MARAELSPGIESLRGKLAGWSGMQARFKKWKDDSGHVIKVGPQELFKRRSRDYKHSPRTAAEAAQAAVWRDACREASAIIKDKNHPRYTELRERWNAQFNSGFCEDGYTEREKNTERKIRGGVRARMREKCTEKTAVECQGQNT